MEPLEVHSNTVDDIGVNDDNYGDGNNNDTWYQQRLDKLQFLRDRSRKLDERLASMRASRISPFELMELSATRSVEAPTWQDKEMIQDLASKIHSLKVQNLCLNYLLNICEKVIPPQVIDFVPSESSPPSSSLDGNNISCENSSNHQTLPNVPHSSGHNDQNSSNKVSNGESSTDSGIKQDVLTSMSRQESQEKSTISTELSDEYLAWICPTCTFQNHPEINSCEACETERKIHLISPINSLSSNGCHCPNKSSCYCHLK
ncbi:uncharacterized protein LOC141852823 [Brevipalpus obovatus]|uniref:uncharacterized protein LOC141852823 n=1 Tax=Brevipalpus obovatus TaxID=246614 RepID=UPI003D9E02EE